MAITAAQVKELRELTGVGMMDCKNALQETNGDMDAAVDWLRTRGLAKAAKKAGRVAAEGLVGLQVEGTRGAVVEVNSETDFVARNEDFQTIVTNVAKLALAVDGDVAALGAASYPETGRTVSGEITEAVAKIGENLNLRRSAMVSVSDGVIGNYVHGSVAPGLGSIGILVGLESTGDKAVLEALGKQLAMHVAAASPTPLAILPEELDAALVERERALFKEQAIASGKPAEIAEKMVEGRMRKFYEEVCLLSQTFVIDGETKVADAIAAAEKDAGAPIKLSAFVRFAIGDGIEKEEGDFAAEVAATAGTR
ncbi:translation elongation factor Ts [Mariluticola halotolerans]|uniref:translation elongation factor Ts n=1 Tax=Mariluticola halotolerans TaxID=2909283 RepID=UPI0026E425E1|nr:translation elongation factor Ts [Mariluticola halotolerans]UJQ94953.1 translation elongation factor Ts [Mariluticola halotolerans]